MKFLLLSIFFLLFPLISRAWRPQSFMASSSFGVRHQQRRQQQQQQQQLLQNYRQKNVIQQQNHHHHHQRSTSSCLFESTSSSDDDNNNNNENIERTSFDQAGKSLIDEEDQQRMEQMGDFDANPEYQTDNIEKMRAAIRARTADLGIEKSKISAEYIQAKKEQAMNAGPGGSSDPDQFAGLDLSKISSTPTGGESKWNEDMPSMFYDPDDELTKEEQEEVDPVMKLNPIEQGLNELNNAKWPGLGAALKEVGLLILIVGFSAVVIIGWDKLLRELYTTAGFIPTKEGIANYASRFDSLDLPKGFTEGMNEADVAQFTDTVTSNLPDL